MSLKATITALILDATSAGRAMVTAANAAAQKALLSLTKSDVGLSNVDNTSDASKPVSTATQTALDAKQATLVSGTSLKTVNGTSLLGAGNVPVSAAPGGVTTQVQYNNAGSLAGMATVTFDGTRMSAYSSSSEGVTIGTRAGHTTTTNDAICIGHEAGFGDAAGRNLTQAIMVGRHAGTYAVEPSQSVILGHAAAQYAVGAGNSVICGYEASRNPNQRATFNCFSAVILGHNAGRNAFASQTSVMIGENAGHNSTNGTCDSVASVLIGWSAASASLNHRESVILGNQAGQSCSSNWSVYVGAYAGQNTSGSFNVFIGYEAGKSLSAANRLVIETNATHRAGGVNALIYGEFDNRLLRFGADTVKLQKDLMLEADQTPASASATGTKGMVRWDASYIYICTAANTWKRVAIATW